MKNSGSRRYLVLARVGDDSLHKSWIADTQTQRTWDLQLNAYGQDEGRIQDGDLPTVIDRGTKWDSIVRHFYRHPDLLDRYTHVMLPDDDVTLTVKDINRVFELVIQHDLTMAQPSLSYASYISYPILFRCPPFRLRYSNYIESMACCMKSSFLKKLLPMFEKHFTGWGTDLIWTMLMDDPAYRSAIIDEVSMTHTRPLSTGSLYKSFSEMKINPLMEISRLRESFENTPNAMLVYGGILRDGRRVGAAETRLRNGLSLLLSTPKSKKKINTARHGAITLVRIVTQFGYVPERLRPIKGTNAEIWFGVEHGQIHGQKAGDTDLETANNPSGT